MTLLDSLLDAIVRLDGDSLVMHVGEKPYVVLSSSAMNTYRGPVSWGQVELSSRPLTSEAVMGMLAQILSPEQRKTLEDMGAVEHEIEAPGHPGRHFIVTAAKGGDDVWVEMRRKPTAVAVAEPEVVPAPAPVEAVAAQPAGIPEVVAIEEIPAPVAVEPPELVVEIAEAEPVPELERTPASEIVGDPQSVVFQFHRDPQETSGPASGTEVDSEPTAWELAAALVDGATEAWEIMDGPSTGQTADTLYDDAIPLVAEPEGVDIPWTANAPIDLDRAIREAAGEVESVPAPVGPRINPPASEIATGGVEDEVPFAVVMPQLRAPLKLQPATPPAVPAASTEASLVALLRTAASRGASTLYAVAGSRPMVRTDGQIAVLGTEPIVGGVEVERFALEFAPRDQGADTPPEWACTIAGIGRVRCITFSDRDGAGLIFHLPSANLSTADELGLEPRIKALSEQAEGLVVVSGPRSSGKSTLLGAFVDLINRTRKDHVITIESGMPVVHEKRQSFISQRDARGDGEALAAAARAALREGPDVLILEDLRAPGLIEVALDAARAGRLVFGSIAAPTASVAVERLIDAFAVERRSQARALLSGALTAVVAQVLLTKPGGGRIGARELLLNSPAVAKLILEGTTAQLPMAIEAGRDLGMMPMIDSLSALVREGLIDAAEACRRAPDRSALVAALERDGIDVSTLERRA